MTVSDKCSARNAVAAADCMLPSGHTGPHTHDSCAWRNDQRASMTIETSTEVVAALRELVQTGLFGMTIANVAEELLRERLREIALARARATAR